MNLVKLTTTSTHVWIRKVTAKYGDATLNVKSMWEIVDNILDNAPISTHDTYEDALDTARFYLKDDSEELVADYAM